MCTREQLGSGTASANLSTRRAVPDDGDPRPAGRPGDVNLGSDGIPMKANWLRGGEGHVTYSGPWDAANPTSPPHDDCGHMAERPFGSIGWSYESPGTCS